MPRKRFGIGFTRRGGGALEDIIVANAEVTNYAARVASAGGKVDGHTVALLDQLVTELKAASVWTLILELYPFCGNSVTAALVKLKYASGVASSLTNVSSALVAADYSQSRGIGPNADNSSKQLLTGFVPSDQGYTQANFGLVVSFPTQVLAKTTGNTIGDNVPGNAAECGIWANGGTDTLVGGNSLYQMYQSLNPTPRVLSFQGTTNRVNAVMDGVALNDSTATVSGTLTSEISFFRSTRYGAQRWANGVVGTVCLTSYMTPAQSKLATAAIAKFERAIRSAYNSGVDGMVGWGDSIMATQGATVTADGWAPKLARSIGKRLSNFGNPAARLTAVADTIVSAIAQYQDIVTQPERLIVISYGTNDGGIPVSDTTYGNDLNTIVSALVAANKEVLICTPCYSSGATYTTTIQRQYAVKCAATAITYGVMFADTNRAIADQTTPTDFMTDVNHPNTAGHEVMRQRAWARLLGRNERSVSLDFGSIAAGANADLTVQVLTARVGQNVSLSLPAAINAGLVFNGFVSADDTVTVRCTNTTGSPIDPAAAFFTVCVYQ